MRLIRARFSLGRITAQGQVKGDAGPAHGPASEKLRQATATLGDAVVHQTKILVLLVVWAAAPACAAALVTAKNAPASKTSQVAPAPTKAVPAVTPPQSKTAPETKEKAGAQPESKSDADAQSKPETKQSKSEVTVQPPVWSAAEIADAKSRCTIILKKINAIAIPQDPIREGACGAPAPIQLISIGKKPEVSISPPATMTCELADALATWLEGDLQPLAKKHLGAEIIKIENMSAYACRNAYGRAKTKLSEHGVANALDIRGFTTSAGKTALVLEDWGTPQREILARLAAEKAAAEKVAEARIAAEKAAQTAQQADKSGAKPAAPPTATGSPAGAPAAGIAHTTIVDGVPKLKVTIPGGIPASKDDPELSIAEPHRLGGPKTEDTALVSDAKSVFLHKAHAAACLIFGTTLGPEANAEHRNHFHVDMAPRKITKICD